MYGLDDLHVFLSRSFSVGLGAFYSQLLFDFLYIYTHSLFVFISQYCSAVFDVRH